MCRFYGMPEPSKFAGSGCLLMLAAKLGIYGKAVNHMAFKHSRCLDRLAQLLAERGAACQLL